jgi:uncharacterized membrane protein
MEREMKQNRFRSVVMWAAVAAQVFVILGVTGGYDVLGIAEPVLKVVVSAILEILTLIGILNNPTDSQGW